MKEFLKKFFDLFKEYQEQIQPHKIEEFLKTRKKIRWLK